jgi:hypothetical protein
MLVHIVADYGPAGDLAFAEVVQRIKLHLPDAEPVLTPVPPSQPSLPASALRSLGSTTRLRARSSITTSHHARMSRRHAKLTPVSVSPSPACPPVCASSV